MPNIIPSAPANDTNPSSAHENAVQSLINGGYAERQAREIISFVRGEAQEEGYNRGAAAARAELDRVRAELSALPAPVVETAFRDGLGNVWPVGHFPAETEARVLETTPTIQRTVRYGEWTEVTS